MGETCEKPIFRIDSSTNCVTVYPDALFSRTIRHICRAYRIYWSCIKIVGRCLKSSDRTVTFTNQTRNTT